jgi:hypothetical protein
MTTGTAGMSLPATPPGQVMILSPFHHLFQQGKRLTRG